MAVIDELLVGLGFEYDPEDLKSFKDDVAKTTGVLRKLATVAITGAAAITGLTIASTKASDEQGKLADEIGDSVENIDALQFALERSGGSADGMSNSLRTLATRAAEAARGVGSGVEAFGILGISSTDANGNVKKTSDLMLEVSQRLQGLSRSQQIELADKLGIRDSIRLLQQGPQAIRDLVSEAESLGVTTAEDAKIAADFQDSLRNQLQVVKDIGRALSRQFVPVLKQVTDRFVEWYKANKDVIQSKLPEWIDKLTIALKLLVIATSAWLATRLISHIISLISLFKGLSVAALAANAAALLLPALIAAGVAALVLLVDEITTFLEGGDSFIGDLVEKFPLLGDVIYAVADAFKFLGDIAKGAWNLIGKFIDTAISGFNKLKETISYIWDKIASIKDINISGTFDDVGNFFSGLNPFSNDKNIPELNNKPNVSNSSSTNVDKIEISVNGAGDPSAVADEVYNRFQQASQDLNSVVDQ